MAHTVLSFSLLSAQTKQRMGRALSPKSIVLWEVEGPIGKGTHQILGGGSQLSGDRADESSGRL